MDSDSHLPHFVLLGERLYLLRNHNNPELIAAELPKLLESLEQCGMRRARTVAKPLEGASIPTDHLGRISKVAAGELRAYVESARSAVYEEAGERILVAIDPGGVLAPLRSLETTVDLTEAQLGIRDETVSCIERAAFRAAIVMGWNLAYDFIRQWVFDNHLQAFNASLTTDYLKKNGKPAYDAIVEYTDFFSGSPSERIVIDTCFSAAIIGERTRDNLRYHLRRRNDYAHPTFREPSREQANAYVKDLLDIVLDRPFTAGSAEVKSKST